MNLFNVLMGMMEKRGFDWAYCVISNITAYSNVYNPLVENYNLAKQANILQECLNSTNETPDTVNKCEQILTHVVDLPNDGRASLSIYNRDIDKNLLPDLVNSFASRIPADEKWVLIFEPTEQLKNNGDTDVCVYKIEANKATQMH